MPKLLLVEDEKNFARVLKDYLCMNEFEVRLCENGEEGLNAFKEEKFDLCIIDIMMPKKDGFSLTQEIKTIDKNIPLVFLTARTLKEDILKAYHLGAEDYLMKPFDSEVLLLKLKVILNRKETNALSDVKEYNIGSIRFHVPLRTLIYPDNKEIKLSPKESELLKLLCLHQNEILAREKALNLIWKDNTYFTGRSMDVYLVKLRKYLSADSNVEINSVHGNGFCLTVKQN